ncbi:hypothetical protein HYV86_03100 [Candidatus Woesearchaeota archaeon]|nr:hypothetical protein [Candidatus Woesearchaeota archaeon]
MSASFTPGWFSGPDLVIDIVSAAVLTLLCIVAFRYYRCSNQKRDYLWFAIATGLLSLSFLAKIFTNFNLYQHIWATKTVGVYTYLYHGVRTSESFLFTTTLLYHLLTLLGLYVLFLLYYKKQPMASIILTTLLLFITVYFTHNTYFIFHLISLLLLTFIIIHYYHTAQKDKLGKMIFWSFSIIALSQLLFIFLEINNILYPIAEGIQLIGYILLLISIIMVRSYGRKTISH